MKQYKDGKFIIMKYKIAFFDIDGTLIDMQSKTMTKKTENALIQLKEQGVILCIATGRPLISIPKFENIDFDMYLSFNGSYCTTGNNVIYEQPIDCEDVRKIIENAQKLNRPVSLASADQIGSNGSDQDLEEYFSFSKQKVNIAEDFDTLAEGKIYQIMMGAVPKDFDSILSGTTSAKITAWWDRAIDIIPVNSGKGEAVKKILEYYHLDVSESIAFGDGENDIEMLQAVGHGIAMGNANEKVQNAADEVCKSVTEDGIYHYFQ